MAVTKKVCRVCGKSYEACRTAKQDVGVFNWREVACSPECGAEYLRRVNEARNPAPVITPVAKRSKAKESLPVTEAVTIISDAETPDVFLADEPSEDITDEDIVE